MRQGQYFFWWVKQFLLPLIESYRKTLEVRPASRVTGEVHVGDCIVFNDTVIRRVRDIRYYASLEAALADENPERIWPEKTHQEILFAAEKLYPPQVLLRGVYVFELESAD